MPQRKLCGSYSSKNSFIRGFKKNHQIEKRANKYKPQQNGSLGSIVLEAQR
jgi:hypothetical protein